ncbi:MAG: ATP-binding protein [Acidobacteriota bacterium]
MTTIAPILSLNTKLLIAFTLVTAIPLIGVSLYISSTATDALREQQEGEIFALLKSLNQDYERTTRRTKQQLNSVAESEEMQQILANWQNASANGENLEISQVLNLLAQKHQFDLLSVHDKDGRILFSLHKPSAQGEQDLEAKKYIDINADLFLKEEYVAEQRTLGIETVVALKSNSREKAKFFLIGGYRVDSVLFKRITDILGLGVKYIFYDLSHNKQFSNADAGFFKLTEELKLETAEDWQSWISHHSEQNRRVRTLKLGNEYFTVGYEQFKSPTNQLLGVLLVGLPTRRAAELQSQLQFVTYTSTVIGLVIAVLLSIFFAYRITRPISSLVRDAQAISRGDLTREIKVEYRDEVGLLSEAFNQMTVALRESQERLLQAERVAAWREMARRLAHDLKNPLFPIQVSIETLRKAHTKKLSEFDEIFEESTSTMLDELKNLKNIIDEFSTFARTPQLRLAEIDLIKVIKQVVSLYTAEFAETQIELQLELNQQTIFISADSEQLARAFKNLVANAIDAMPAGGKLSIKADTVDGKALIEVTDSGIGLSEESQARLFTPYYTKKPKGTGLGLSIVQSIVADHHGRILVKSKPGQGTSFFIELERLMAHNG